MNAKQLSSVLRELGDPAIAEHSQRFFKTGKGEYGEGDKFLGVRVPVLRVQAKKHRDLSLAETQRLLMSSFHEERLCAVILLVLKFAKADDQLQKSIYELYLKNTRYINNWDIVDSSAHQIVGGYLIDKNKRPLTKLSKSSSLWERRIAIIATYHFIKQGEFDTALDLSERLLSDHEDLIHKAVGWMLREIGNRSPAVERAFLKPRYKNMPRTMLRYAIEKFSDRERKTYLHGTV